MRERAFVREVGLRDGLQSLAEIMPTEQKIAWIDAEHAAGVHEIEVSSFVPPKLLPQLADAEAVVRHALALPGLTVSALIPNLRGAERGLAPGPSGDRVSRAVSPPPSAARSRVPSTRNGCAASPSRSPRLAPMRSSLPIQSVMANRRRSSAFSGG